MASNSNPFKNSNGSSSNPFLQRPAPKPAPQPTSNRNSGGGGSSGGNQFVNPDGTSSNPFLQGKQSTPAPKSSGGGGGGSGSGSSSNQNIGTFTDAKTGQGYSGVQKSEFDLPVSGGVQSTSFGRSSGGGGSSSSSLPQSSFTNITPSASKGQTMESVASQSIRSSNTNIAPAPSSVSIRGPTSSYAGTQKTSFLEATKQVGGNLLYDVGIAFGGKSGNYKNPFDPYQSVGKEKYEDTSFYIGENKELGINYKISPGSLASMGIGSDGAFGSTAVPKGTTLTPVTFLEEQKTIETYNAAKLEEGKQYFTSIGQGRVDAGEDIGTVTQDVNKQFLEFQSKNILPEVRGGNIREGTLLSTGIPKAIETGALVGASAFGGPAGLAVASAYTFGQGFKQTVEADTLGGKALGLATIGLSGLGVRSSLLGIETNIVNSEIQSSLRGLSSSKLKFNQVELQTDSGGLFTFKASQKFGGFEREIKGQGLFLTNDKGLSFVPVGKYSSTTSGKVWNIYGPSKTVYGSSEIGSFTGISQGATKMPFVSNVGGFSTKRIIDLPEGTMSFYSKFGTTKSSSAQVITGFDSVRGKIGKFSTDVKLFPGTKISSKGSSLGLTKELEPDAFGNKLYSTASVSRNKAGDLFMKGSSKGNIKVIARGEADSSLFSSSSGFSVTKITGPSSPSSSSLSSLGQESKSLSSLNTGQKIGGLEGLGAQISKASASGFSLASPKLVPQVVIGSTQQKSFTTPSTKTSLSFSESVSDIQSSSPRQRSFENTISSTRTLESTSSGFRFDTAQTSITEQGTKLVTPTLIAQGPGFGIGGFGFDFGFGGGLPSFQGLGGGGPVRRKKGRKGSKVPILTSFSGSILGFKGLPSGGSFGITPFQQRGIASSRKSRKLTDL